MIWNRKLKQENKALQERIEAYEKALTPSTDTKYRHSGEYEFSVELYDAENEEHYSQIFSVPWTTVKEIMKSIRKDANGG